MLGPQTADVEVCHERKDLAVAAKLEKELLVARKLIELAGKAHEILGVALPSIENGEGL